MKKVIAAFNMTLDGFCDHTSGIPADEIHFHYARQLEEAGVHVVYGLVGYKIHGKMLLVVRNENEGIRRYVGWISEQGDVRDYFAAAEAGLRERRIVHRVAATVS